ncbi:MAG: diadenylate cyclase [Phycisphaerae bacterium]|nr:diadenylate cyclase [Phycisphaerae bacterium]
MLDAFTRVFQRLGGSAGDPGSVVIELILIGLALYWCVSKLEGTRGTRPLRQLLVILLIVTLGVRLFGSTRLDILYRFFVIGIAITALAAFQPELRRAFIRVGDVTFTRRRGPQARLINALVKSAGYLSRNKYGGLVALQRVVDLQGWAENGTLLNAEVSANLLNTIFFPNTPLHDLGVIVRGNRVLAANCQFPSAESDEVDAALGSRHLAAIGMSYESDALVLVVSEETGAISLADNGKLTRYLSMDDLERELESRLNGVPRVEGQGKRRKGSLSGAWFTIRRFLVVVPLTLIIWYLADQATQVAVDNIQFQLIPQLPRDRLVMLDDPPSGQFTVSMRGSNHAIDVLRGEAVGDIIMANWQTDQFLQIGQHTLPAREVLEQLPLVRTLGLTVENVQPDSLSIRVDRPETRTVPVHVDSGSVLTAEHQIDPPEVALTLPQAVWQELGSDEALVIAPVASQVTGIEPGQRPRLTGVVLQPPRADLRAVSIDPPTVNIRLLIAARSRDIPPIQSVPVRLSFSQGFWRRYADGTHRLELLEPLEWLITELKLRVDQGDVTSVSSQDVDAFVLITEDLFDTPGIERTLDVTIRRPAGVSLVGPTPQVRVRLVEVSPGG